MALFEQYRAELNQEIDWDYVAGVCKREGSYYLGKSTRFVPSGKYYMPFACSNVDACPQCHGTGVTKKLYPCEFCTDGWRKHPDQWGGDSFEAIAGRIKENHPMDDHYLWVDYKHKHIRCWACNRVDDGHRIPGQVRHACMRCGGLGSHEVYQDQEYWRALEYLCEKHDLFLESGDGDPLDTFICSPDISEEQAAERYPQYA